MAEAHVVYQSVFEGLFERAIGKRMTPALKAKLKTVGVDLDFPLKAAYPKDIWQGIVDACCSELYPGVEKPEALYKLGFEMVAGYGSSLLGRTMLQMTKLLGPTRTLERTGKTFRAGNNFSEVKMTAKGPRDYEMWMNEVAESATFIKAALVAVLQHAGAKDIVVEIVRDPTPPSGKFLVRWSE